MTREEALRELDESSLSQYSEEFGVLFVWEYKTSSDKERADALGAQLFAISDEHWFKGKSPAEFMAMVLTGEAT